MPYHHDPLWGEISLEEPVIRALVSSSPVQRLRGIAQAGASAYLSPEKAAITRFDHSLGVMHVLSQMGAALEEQVAGLLHDVPHTAFSHTADIAFPSAEYNFHEQFQHNVILESNIPAILASHGINLQAALEPGRYSLLEQPSPALCADRLDYTLRDRHAAGHVSSSEAVDYLNHLIPGRNGIVHTDIDSALWFARHFTEANRTSWTSPDDAGAYWALGNAVRRAIEIGCLARSDLFATDAEVMKQLLSLHDAEITAYLRLLRPGTHFYVVRGDGPCFETYTKQRVIDPQVQPLGAGEPGLLSELCKSYAQILASLPPAGSVTYRLWSDQMPPLLQQIYWDMSQARARA